MSFHIIGNPDVTHSVPTVNPGVAHLFPTFNSGVTHSVPTVNSGVAHSVPTAFMMNAVGTEWFLSGLPSMVISITVRCLPKYNEYSCYVPTTIIMLDSDDQ